MEWQRIYGAVDFIRYFISAYVINVESAVVPTHIRCLLLLLVSSEEGGAEWISNYSFHAHVICECVFDCSRR